MELMRRYSQLLLRFRWLVVLATVGATIGLGVSARNLVVVTTPDQVLPAHHPYVVADKLIAERFGGRRYAIVALIPKQGTVWTVPVMRLLSELTLDLYHSDGVRAANLLSLASPNARDIRAAGESMDIEPLMPPEPPQTDADVAAIKAAYERNPLYRGTLVSEDQRAAMLIVDFWPGFDSEKSFEVVSAAVARHQSPDVDIHMTGLSVMGHYFHEYASEVGKYFLLAFLAIMLVLYVGFRSVQSMLIPLATGIQATLWALGLMALGGAQLDGYNVMTPILVLAIGAGHSVQMLKRYYEEMARYGDNDRAVIESTSKIGVVMIAAGLTAALGFLALLSFDTPSMRAFGLFTGLGILSVVAIELTFVPALRSILPAPKAARVAKKSGFVGAALDRLGETALGPRSWMIPAALAAVAIISVIGLLDLEVRNSVKNLLPKDSLPRRDLEALEEHFPGHVNMTILLRNRDGSEFKGPAELAFLEGLQHELEKDPLVYKTASLVDSLKRMHMAMNYDDPSFNVLPKDPALLAQYLFMGYSTALERFLDTPQKQAVLWTYMRNDEANDIHRLLDRAQKYIDANAPAGVEVMLAGGAGPIIVALNDVIIKGKVENIVVVSAVIFVIACIVFRSLIAGLFVVAPLAITALVDLGVLGLFGLGLNMTTASVVSMAVGIGADYAIYLLYRTREEYRRLGRVDESIRAALDTSGRAILFVAVAIASGYGVLFISPFAAYWMLGLMVPLTMMVSCAVSVALLPYLLGKWQPAFAFPDAAPAPILVGEEPAPQ